MNILEVIKNFTQKNITIIKKELANNINVLKGSIEEVANKAHTHDNIEVIRNLSANEEGFVLYKDEPLKAIAEVDTTGLMTKEAYDTDNDGIVDIANNIQGVHQSQPWSYYGKDGEGNIGIFPIPVTPAKIMGKLQAVKLDVKANETITVGLLEGNTSNNVFVQCYEYEQGEQDIIKTLKVFNNSERDNFYYNEENISFTNGMEINTEYELSFSLNEDGLYESDVALNNFLEVDKVIVKTM